MQSGAIPDLFQNERLLSSKLRTGPRHTILLLYPLETASPGAEDEAGQILVKRAEILDTILDRRSSEASGPPVVVYECASLISIRQGLPVVPAHYYRDAQSHLYVAQNPFYDGNSRCHTLVRIIPESWCR